jgi:hypothetical protein
MMLLLIVPYAMIIVSIILNVLVLSRLDEVIQKKKQFNMLKKEKLFYEIFYPEMLQIILNIPLKVSHEQNNKWPFQKLYFKNIVQLYHENFVIEMFHFQPQMNHKPLVKFLFEIPFQFDPFIYLNHKESIEIPFYIYHHHYIYQSNNQSQTIRDLIDAMDRCPHLLDLEMIFNGQSAIFMCKIEGVTFMHNVDLKDKNLKKHLNHLNYINDVWQYINKTLKEFNYAHRK